MHTRKAERSQHGYRTFKVSVEKNDFSKHDIVITGGEPSFHEKYLDIVYLMCDKARSVTVTSNGTLNLRLAELIGLDNLFFQISLDGNQKIHDQIRGENAFNRTWHTLQMMDSMKIKYAVASVVSKKNKIEIFDLLSMLESLKNMKYWRISYEMPFGNAAGVEDIMSAEEWNSFVEDLLFRAKFKVKIQKIFPFDLYEKRKVELEQATLTRKRNVNCGSGTNKIYVYPDFKVYPCTCLTDFCIGNLCVQPLEKIMSGNEIQQFSEYKLESDSKCQECEYKKFCNGGCVGMSYYYFGKLGMGDLRCPKIFGGK